MNFLIGGTIVDDDSQKWAFEDVTPSQVRAVIGKLEDGEDITFEISSPGGSVTAGIAIANLIREASANGHHTNAKVIGIAASMASVIACACDDITIAESAFMMIHNPWTVTQGDSEEIRKEADTLDKMRDAMISFYRGKFSKTDEEIKAMMDAETWFSGAECETFGFKATVEPSETLKMAACSRSIPAFANAPEVASKMFVLGKHEEPMITVAECEKRVSGMQSAMAKQIAAKNDEIEALKATIKAKDDELSEFAERLYAKDKEFKDQHSAISEELSQAKAQLTSLADSLSNVNGELQTARDENAALASALEAKKTALAKLNAGVNTPNSTKIFSKKSLREQMAALPPSERQAFFDKHAAEF